MNVCPICLFVNAAAADGCARCGKFHFASGRPAVVADPPPSSHASGRSTRVEMEQTVVTKPSGVVSAARLFRTPPPVTDPSAEVSLAAARDTNHNSTSPTARLVLKPRVEVVRGERTGAAFALLDGRNYVGRMVNEPVDIDLTGQERPERVWTSRRHICLHFDGRAVVIEDLNSLNGTFVNRQRVLPGHRRVLQAGDVIQVGTVQLRLHVDAERVDG